MAAARAHREANADLLVPATYECPDGFKLGRWIVKRRSWYRQGRLSPERIAELDTLGMVWAVRKRNREPGPSRRG